MQRPSESLSAVVGTIVGAIATIIGKAFKVEIDPLVTGALITLVSFIAMFVTTIVAKKQRDGDLGSAKDGTVLT